MSLLGCLSNLLLHFSTCRHYAVQLNVELINQLRTSDSLQCHLVADVSFTRTMRSELHGVIVRELTEILDRRVPNLTVLDRRHRLSLVSKWSHLTIRESPLTPMKIDGDQRLSIQGTSSPESVNDSSGGSETPNSTDISAIIQQSRPWSYGELRALLLSRYDCQDAHRTLLFGTDRALPMSVIARLCQSLCVDLHDPYLPIASQSVCVRALLVLIEWVDKLSHGQRLRTSGVSASPQQPRFIDQKEAADILRRSLESSSAKLGQLRRDLPQVGHNFHVLCLNMQ